MRRFARTAAAVTFFICTVVVVSELILRSDIGGWVMLMESTMFLHSVSIACALVCACAWTVTKTMASGITTWDRAKGIIVPSVVAGVLAEPFACWACTQECTA